MESLEQRNTVSLTSAFTTHVLICIAHMSSLTVFFFLLNVRISVTNLHEIFFTETEQELLKQPII